VNGLEDVRTTVHAALVAGVLDAGVLPVTSVHPYPPDELALPAIWVTSPFGMRPSDARTIVAEVSVIVAVDGAEAAQIAALDTLQAVAWVALETVGTATLATPTLLAAGGAALHAVTISADVDVDVRTLCPPVLTLAAH
jgi:hypothetical protein